MLIRKPVPEAIAQGSVTCLFRRWDRPRVRPGTTWRTSVGVLEVTAVDEVADADLTGDDAVRSGHGGLDALRAENARWDGTLFRISLHFVGEDPRIALRSATDLDDDDRAALRARLERMDRVPHGPWTAAVLDLIATHPGVRAPDLAGRLGREAQPFKRDVRKLKELGLTESLEVGYRLSPRGRAWLGLCRDPTRARHA